MAIRQVVAAHRAGNPRVFGSVAHGEDTENSDLDLLVDPQPKMSLFDPGAIIAELNELLGIQVDVATPGGTPPADAGAHPPRRRSDMIRPSLRIRDYLGHILEAIDRVSTYTASSDEASFMADKKTQDAVIRNLEIIGEAAQHLRACL
jgi:predicted nucleotidyltransferase